jgi:hypothetical protein
LAAGPRVAQLHFLTAIAAGVVVLQVEIDLATQTSSLSPRSLPALFVLLTHARHAGEPEA